MVKELEKNIIWKVSHEKFDLVNTLEARMINNDDTFSETTSLNNHDEAFRHADSKTRLINNYDYPEFLDPMFPDDNHYDSDYESDHFQEEHKTKTDGPISEYYDYQKI